MKKLITLITLIAAGTVAYAQRQVDLGVFVVSPANNLVYHSGDAVTIALGIFNAGTTNLDRTDSFQIKLYYNGNLLYLVSSSNPSQPYPAIYNVDTTAVNAGDTIYLSLPQQIGFTYNRDVDTTVQFCAVVVPYNRTVGDTIGDPALTNNQDCISLLEKAHPLGVKEFRATTSGTPAIVSVYPNPASTEAKFAIDLPLSSDVSVTIMDIAGRVVLTQNFGKMDAGENTMSINTGGLANGLYLYRVSANKAVASGKFNVLK